MKLPAAGIVAVSSCIASFFLATSYIHAQAEAAELSRGKDLVDLCRRARDGFRPLTGADRQEVKTELIEAVERLDHRLNAAGENGSNWRKYLQWKKLAGQLKGSEEPGLDELNAVYKKYTAEHEGLRLIWFLEVRQALRRYRDTTRNIDNPKLKPAFGQLIDGLADRLEAYLAKPTAEQALVIGQAIGQLEGARQVPELVREIRRQLSHPNLLLEVSADVLGAGIAEPIDDVTPIRDYILGTDVYGTGHTVGRTELLLLPNPDRAMFETLFSGISNSRNVGYHGSLTIRSKATSQVTARKRIHLDQQGFALLPANSRISTDTEITSIRHRRGSPCIEKIAWKRAGKQKSRAECIASQHAQQRVNRRIDAEAGEKLGQANKAFKDKFRKPLLERKLFPQTLGFSTTETALHVVSLLAGPAQLAAPSEPIELIEGRDMALRVHESTINNMAASALGGYLLREERLQEIVVGLFGELPPQLQKEEGQEPWGIGFSRLRPISVEFSDDGFKVTIRGRNYYKGEDRHPAMNVSAAYKIAKTEQGYKAVRQGEVEILPPGFKPGSGRSLSARQVVIRTLLKRRFDNVFPEEMLGEGMELPGRWNKAGRMKPAQLVCRDGWLTIAWKRAASEQ